MHYARSAGAGLGWTDELVPATRTHDPALAIEGDGPGVPDPAAGARAPGQRRVPVDGRDLREDAGGRTGRWGPFGAGGGAGAGGGDVRRERVDEVVGGGADPAGAGRVRVLRGAEVRRVDVLRPGPPVLRPPGRAGRDRAGPTATRPAPTATPTRTPTPTATATATADPDRDRDPDQHADGDADRRRRRRRSRVLVGDQRGRGEPRLQPAGRGRGVPSTRPRPAGRPGGSSSTSTAAARPARSWSACTPTRAACRARC